MEFIKILNIIINTPEFKACEQCEQHNYFHLYNVGEHMFRACWNMEDPSNPRYDLLRIAALIHDMGKPQTKTTRDDIDHFYGHAAPSAEIAEKLLRPMIPELIGEIDLVYIVNLIKEHDMGLGWGKALDSLSTLRALITKYGMGFVKDLFYLIEADVSAQNPEHHQGFTEQLEDARELLTWIPQMGGIF